MKSFKAIVHKIVTNQNIKNTLTIALGGIIGSFFSYLLLFFLGRKLDVQTYGLYSSLISLSTLLVIPTEILGISIIKRTSELAATKELNRFAGFFYSLIGFALLISIILFTGINLAGPFIQTKLQIADSTIITVFAVLTGLTFPSGIFTASLKGLTKYTASAVYNMVFSSLRMTFALIPLYMGLGLVSIFSGMSVALVISFTLAIVLVNVAINKADFKNIKRDYKKLFIFGLPAALLAITQTYLTNMDIVLVRRYFDPQLTGYYAGAVTLGKLFLFGCTSVATVMYPQVVAEHARKKNPVKVFVQLFKIQFGLILTCLFVYLTFPELISQVFFGAAFDASVPYIRTYAIFIALFIIMNFFSLYLLAVEKTKVFGLFLPAMAFQYIYITLAHENLHNIIIGNIIAVLVIIGLLVGAFAKNHQDHWAQELRKAHSLLFGKLG